MDNNAAISKDPRGERWAGSKTCGTCHSNIANSYAHTNHFKTSSKSNKSDLKKQSDLEADSFYFATDHYTLVEEKDGNYFQTSFVNDTKTTSASFDIAFGSGEKAQTYGYWKNGQLYQLPLTWFTTNHAWANSPGFPESKAHYDRVIISRCFECHSSYVDVDFKQETALSTAEVMDKNSIVFGIDCERCHGPGMGHVSFHKENPAAKKSMHMAAWKSLSRQQQLDACAVCHSGNDMAMQRSSFAFVPGDTLSHFSYPGFGEQKTKEPDVHGKQMQLLQSSACFKASKLTCTSCHSPHEAEKNLSELFVSKCMSCHQSSTHAQKNLLEFQQAAVKNTGSNIKNCINCHMPLQPSKDIFFGAGLQSGTIPYLLRTHRIGIY